MGPTSAKGFFSGFAAGAMAVLLALPVWLLVDGNVTELQLHRVLSWSQDNLGLSMPVFAFVFLLFLSSLLHLRRCLSEARPVAEVSHAEQLTDTWTSLFFGVGVIWTAIGMRGALLFALGDPDLAVTEGAFAVLQRMIDGGILLALSTTIFGGVGGYLMRIAKTVAVGAALRRYYDQASRAQGEAIHATLTRIEERLQGYPHEPSLSAEVEDHAQRTMASGAT